MLKTVVGIDLSLRSTGIAIFYPDGKTFMTKAITPDVGAPYPERILEIARGVLRTVADDDLPVIEDYAFHADTTNLTRLAELGGVVKMALWKRTKAWPLLVNNQTIKKWVAGSGSAKKEDMKLALYKKYGLEFQTSDEADAFALADFGWHVHKPQQPRRKLTAAEAEQIEKFLKKISKPVKSKG